MTELDVVGKSLLRQDALEMVTGQARYSADVAIPGLLHAKLLRSPFPHARIISINTARAEKLPGVWAVIGPDDVPRFPPGPFWETNTPCAATVSLAVWAIRSPQSRRRALTWRRKPLN